MKILHFSAGLEKNNGMANTARQFVSEETAAGHDSQLTNDLEKIERGVDEVVIHGAWLPILWRAAKRAKTVGAKLLIRPAGSYDPVRLAYHGWKKRLVSFWEHRMLRRADVLLATCAAEAEWIRAYESRFGGLKSPRIEITDLKRFFNLSTPAPSSQTSKPLNLQTSKLHLLYLGRRHPLKGVEYLEKAVREIGLGQRSGSREELRIVSNHFGEELEKDWDWCDVLVLPTLSENFGRVIAEALERGKRVLTTDGAPAWGEGLELRVESGGVEKLGVGSEIWSGYGGQLIYLKGYRDGTDAERVELLKRGISFLAAKV